MAAANLSGPSATPKGLRHGFAIAALDKNVPLNMVQKWLGPVCRQAGMRRSARPNGHVRAGTTAIYGDAIGAEETSLAARLWEE